MKKSLVLLIASLVIFGCSMSSTGNTASTDRAGTDASETTGEADSTTSTETTDRPEVTMLQEFNQPEDEILATYLAYHEALAVAWGEPEADPAYAPLYELVVDPQATIDRDALNQFRTQGRVTVDEPNSETSHATRFVGAFTPDKEEGNSVTLLDCNVDATKVVSVDGELLNDEVATFVLAVEMRVVDGSWRVAAIDVKDRYEGVNECAEYANL